MKQTRKLIRGGGGTGESETFRIVNAAGTEVTSFTLSDKHPGVTLHLERPARVAESLLKRLERDAWAFYDALFQTLEKVDAIDPDAALDIYAEMFAEDEEE